MRLKINCNWHKFVDLGLPSGLLWAMCNIGASEPWESGLYFSWGNVKGHEKGSGYYFDNAAYKSTPGGELTTDIPVDAGYDTARANLGGGWRLPTAFEFQELDGNCTSVWTMQNGVYGRLFISMINGNRVFFPAAACYIESTLFNDCIGGYYWSSSMNSQTSSKTLHLTRNSIETYGGYYRSLGFTVRGVLDHPKDSLLIKTIKR